MESGGLTGKMLEVVKDGAMLVLKMRKNPRKRMKLKEQFLEVQVDTNVIFVFNVQMKARSS